MQLFKPILSQETGCYFEYVCYYVYSCFKSRRGSIKGLGLLYRVAPRPGGGGGGIPKYLKKNFQYTKNYTKTRVKYQN